MTETLVYYQMDRQAGKGGRRGGSDNDLATDSPRVASGRDLRTGSWSRKKSAKNEREKQNILSVRYERELDFVLIFVQ